jgi:hypothetical protein
MVEGLSEYRFDVPDGDYEVELLFTETKFETPGKRVFDVLVNGSPISEKIDLALSVGRDRVFRKHISVVAEGGLSITFRPRVGDPVLSGVRILRRDPSPLTPAK